MVQIDNMYFNIGEDYDPNKFKEEILEAYRTKERVRIIFDLDNKKISLSGMRKIKKIFEEIGVEGLEETCIICHEKFKIALIKNFLKLVKTERPVKFIN